MINTIHSLLAAIDSDESLKGEHSDRVPEYTLKLINHLHISDKERVEIYLGSIIHDLGKIGIPDEILKKNNTLTKHEFNIIKEHPEIGKKFLIHVDLPKSTLKIVSQHHEKFNGTGYPKGLSGNEIYLGARIVSIVDVFDALLSDRFYRKGWSLYKVINYIKEEKGKSFDPEIVNGFMEVIESEK